MTTATRHFMRVRFTEAEAVRVRAFIYKHGHAAACKLLECGHDTLTEARSMGSALPQTRERLLARLAENE